MLLGVIISLFSFQINAQSVETGVLPSITSAEGQFTEWKKVEFTASGQNVTYEYRIAFMKRKALACNYEVQLKNTSGQKLSIKLTSHSYSLTLLLSHVLTFSRSHVLMFSCFWIF